ncbi:TetR/AcrR family transcriptional regulator [Nocardioides acrostichi]|uniref:TetR/AcrR family transcriptional regulator n=1 Tax=Nocardioides acrostichi TaxID=2784339 RepID=A0A930Y910_9ACTN|nr:TetR/AcrR family transcriptional regulator [Nocardioides acrostichi]MBF4163672.1 TetR/AcrR family transcriptional regulator [Nocardioides acrostichi]
MQNRSVLPCPFSPGGPLTKREQTWLRIVRAAQALCLDRGFDGFTLDELAEASDVSRRTLFNYFPSKVDAVLGGGETPDLLHPDPRQPHLVEATELFRRGGPHGRLLEDLTALSRVLVDGAHPDRSLARSQRAILFATPRLLGEVHERFLAAAGTLVALVREREPELDEGRGRLFVRLLVAVFDNAVETWVEQPDDDPRTLADVFETHLEDAVHLLHP